MEVENRCDCFLTNIRGVNREGRRFLAEVVEWVAAGGDAVVRTPLPPPPFQSVGVVGRYFFFFSSSLKQVRTASIPFLLYSAAPPLHALPPLPCPPLLSSLVLQRVVGVRTPEPLLPAPAMLCGAGLNCGQQQQWKGLLPALPVWKQVWGKGICPP